MKNATRSDMIRKLDTPTGKVDIILDTDAYNEIDDQFAISYALLSPERITTVAICAAPFKNSKSTDAGDGMGKSYNEIIKLLGLMNKNELEPIVYKGSRAFLQNESTPVISEAAEKMVEIARRYSPEAPLYIVAIGAITNVASAILLDRDVMVNNTVIVWLGGHAFHMPDNREFNLYQDVAAARVVFGCGVPLVQLPCKGVVSALTTTEGELRSWLSGTGALGEYLLWNTVREAEGYAKGTAWSRCIWDVSAIAWLMNDGDRFMRSYITPSPIPQYDHHYSFDPTRHPIRYVYYINRDAIFTDLFKKLREC